MAGSELQGFQRKRLLGLCHRLKPVVQVGHRGLTRGVFEEASAALRAHELIKVRMMEPEDKKAMARELAKRCDARLCGLVGHTVILYRPHPERPRIELPSR